MRKIKSTSLLIALSSLLVVWCGFEVLYSTGKVGRTKKNPVDSGCYCHSPGSPTDTILVYVTGPETVTVGSSNVYTLHMLGGPSVVGGFNVAVGQGSLQSIDTTTRVEEGELTHTLPKTWGDATVSWQFMYTAPVTAALDTIYSVGNSSNDDMLILGDEYNFGVDFYVTIIDSLQMTANDGGVDGTMRDETYTVVFDAFANSSVFYPDTNGGSIKGDVGINILGDDSSNIVVEMELPSHLIGTIGDSMAITFPSSGPGSGVRAETGGFFNPHVANTFNLSIYGTCNLRLGYGFTVPSNATEGDTYVRQIFCNAYYAGQDNNIQDTLSAVITLSVSLKDSVLSVVYENTLSEFELYQNYPNPFNPLTVIRYQLSEGGFVSVKVFDLSGKEISTLVDEVQSPGFYSINFDGSGLASGIYYYQLVTDDVKLTKKLLLVR